MAAVKGNPGTQLIAVEGLNGVGKTTLVPLIAERLRIPHVAVVPPDATPARRLFEDAPFSTAAMLFYLSWSKRLSDELRANAYGSWLICDRYVASTRAYFSAAGSGREDLIAIADIAPPALTVLVTAEESVRRQRLDSRCQLRKLELATYDTKFRDMITRQIRTYQPLIEVDNTERPPTATAAEAAQRIRKFVTAQTGSDVPTPRSTATP